MQGVSITNVRKHGKTGKKRAFHSRTSITQAGRGRNLRPHPVNCPRSREPPGNLTTAPGHSSARSGLGCFTAEDDMPRRVVLLLLAGASLSAAAVAAPVPPGADL